MIQSPIIKNCNSVSALIIYLIITSFLVVKPNNVMALELNDSLLPTCVLYNRVLNDKSNYPELQMKGVSSHLTNQGLEITGKEKLVKLNYYYSLAERLIRYHVSFSKDAIAVFESDKGDFKAFVDVANKKISISTNPVKVKIVDFLNYKHDYIIEIHRDYQVSKIRVIDLYSGDSTELEATNDGTGGCGAGAIGKGFIVGRQYDYYCFGLQSGSRLIVKQICVLAKECDLALLIYGDSISEPEGYFPASDFQKSWTQLIMKNIGGKAVSSGRGGTTIVELLERIKNELPFIKSKYVMVTIGTNGGNTEENLSKLVEYIISQGSIPILNNIPCNESGTQVQENALIETIRKKYKIKGCKFDIATSLKHDGREVDKSAMWFEDYDWGKIYHHPNVKGSILMYWRTLIDVPEIYE